MTLEDWFIVTAISTGTTAICSIVALVHLSRVERRIQDLTMIVLATNKPGPEHLDEDRVDQLRKAVQRTWRQGS
jgi:hypothetical protein